MRRKGFSLCKHHAAKTDYGFRYSERHNAMVCFSSNYNGLHKTETLNLPVYITSLNSQCWDPHVSQTKTMLAVYGLIFQGLNYSGGMIKKVNIEETKIVQFFTTVTARYFYTLFLCDWFQVVMTGP